MPTEQPNYQPGHVVTFRLDETDPKLISVLRRKLGLNTTGLLRLALRRLAEVEGVNVQKQASLKKKSA